MLTLRPLLVPTDEARLCPVKTSSGERQCRIYYTHNGDVTVTPVCRWQLGHRSLSQGVSSSVKVRKVKVVVQNHSSKRLGIIGISTNKIIRISQLNNKYVH